ncbi:phage head closure protein [Massilia forsythiae]|uniref:Phage head closure protein n=1 Tax=Massilia forsythiae TaxID=2728020 RepID=A0A7Z2W1G7_9BURK|nr:phage head closure protein [Massilia forsythiae]QJE03048.1 phage head closure protein [Massilia forsythiae]
MTQAFALDKRVTLQARSGTRDGLNAPARSWANVLGGDGKMWAWVRDITGRQYVAAGGTQNTVQTEIGIRRRAGVLPSMRVLHGGFTYDIQAVLEHDRNWLILMCKKGPANG